MRLLIVFFTSILLYNLAYAKEDARFNIDKVDLKCASETACADIRKMFSSLARDYTDTEHFHSVLKLYVSNSGIKKFNYLVVKKNKEVTLKIVLEQKYRINDVLLPKFIGKYEIETPSVIPLRINEFLDNQNVLDSIKLYKEIAKDKGFPHATVARAFTYHGGTVDIRFNIDLGEPVKVVDIIVNSQSRYLKRLALRKLQYHLKKPFDVQQLKTEIEEMRLLNQQYGYYLIDFDLKYQTIGSSRVKLFLDVKNATRYAFYIARDSFLEQDVLKTFLAEELIASKREYTVDNLSFLLKEKYLGLGFTEAEFKITENLHTDKNQDKIKTFFIDIKLNKRGKVKRMLFKGNNYLSQERLHRLFYKNASEQAAVDVFDAKYYNDFIEIIREEYIRHGFVSVFIDKPGIRKNKNNEYTLTFKIREGIRAFVDSLKISGLSDEQVQNLKEKISNNVGKYFNPIAFKEDLTLIKNYLKQEGYYFGQIVNQNKKDLVRYEADNSIVNIFIEIESGPKVYADDIIIIGNQKTKKKLIKRELAFHTGSLLTSHSIESSQTNLLSLGLFSSVQIKPVTQNKDKTDVLIFVREKDFGSVELAPGVRSDIGFKISGEVNYNNIDGMNKRITLKSTINRRFDLSNFDSERRHSEKLLEYDMAVSYTEDYIFDWSWNFSTYLQQARRRLYSYDVDIRRVGFTFSRQFYSWLSFLTRYQLENFSQFNATEEINQGHFQIGSVTPSVNLDFRNRRVNPTSGTQFNFSVEFANPSFLSQANDELTINYYKAVSRNKFYIPLSEKMTFAISAAFGYQENKATTKDAAGNSAGYIPNLKVFRLSGADIVRGYLDKEINTLVTGQDISDVEVNSRAYMTNLKFEPRYYLSDSSILALFYDAGRVFVGNYESDQLRSSVGVSFKFITPVGTIDIDYGIKTLRKLDSSGKLESPGALHVQIGFF